MKQGKYKVYIGIATPDGNEVMYGSICRGLEVLVGGRLSKLAPGVGEYAWGPDAGPGGDALALAIAADALDLDRARDKDFYRHLKKQEIERFRAERFIITELEVRLCYERYQGALRMVNAV